MNIDAEDRPRPPVTTVPRQLRVALGVRVIYLLSGLAFCALALGLVWLTATSGVWMGVLFGSAGVLYFLWMIVNPWTKYLIVTDDRIGTEHRIGSEYRIRMIGLRGKTVRRQDVAEIRIEGYRYTAGLPATKFLDRNGRSLMQAPPFWDKTLVARWAAGAGIPFAE